MNSQNTVDDSPQAQSLQQRKLEIAAATRLLNAEGILGYSGHVSFRVDEPGGLLIQPFDVSRAEITPELMLLCDFDGTLLQGADGLKPPSEVYIHTEIYRARPDVNAIAHFHPESATLFTMAEGAVLRPMKNHAIRWADGIPTFPDPGHVNSPALGQALAETLGSCQAALMRAHGVVVVAESVPGVMIDAVHFEENAEAAFRAAQLGPMKPLTEAEIEAFAVRFRRASHIRKLWAYYVNRGFASGSLPAAWRASLP